MQLNTFPRDLLLEGKMNRRESKLPRVKEEESESESESMEVELNLGLSLGGRFGVDRSRNSWLVRSSSIVGALPTPVNDVVLSPLARTASLPVEMEDEWRKRGEIQNLRRLEAKRRRSEVENHTDLNLTAILERGQYVSAMIRVGSSAGPHLWSPMWAYAVIAAAGSQGGSELDSKGAEAKMNKNTSKEEVKNSPADKPAVYTMGKNGRRMDGVLHKYGSLGDEVTIMCVCHGGFHSPAEFIQHAGGPEVVNPLKHIVVDRAFPFQ